MSKQLERPLAAAKKAEARAASILAHETLIARLRDAQSLARMRDYAATGDVLESVRDLVKALSAAPAAEGSE